MSKIEMTFRNCLGAIEKVVVDTANEYARELWKAKEAGWRFMGATLL